jgi:hypothetical protein
MAKSKPVMKQTTAGKSTTKDLVRCISNHSSNDAVLEALASLRRILASKPSAFGPKIRR